MNKLLPIMLLLFPCCLFAADWPQFRGVSSNGFAADKGINTAWASHPPKVLWTVALTDDGFAGPSVAGGLVYITDHWKQQDIVRALDLHSGKERWRYCYPEAGPDIYGHARATPAVCGGKVYTLSQLGQLHCLDARTGKKLWALDIVKDLGGKTPQWFYSMSPLLDGNALILCPGGMNAAVAAVNRHTGKMLWRGGGSDAPGYATPVAATIHGIKQYVIFAGAALLGVDAASGMLLWRCPWTTPLDAEVNTPAARAHFNANAAAPIVIGNTVFITTGYQHGSALVDVANGKASVKWCTLAMQSQYSSPIYANGFIYCSSDPRKLVCLNAATGAIAWQHDGIASGGGLAAIGGKLLVMDGASGEVILVSLSSDHYLELARIKPLGGESRTAPVLADGMLLVRNRKALACVDLR